MPLPQPGLRPAAFIDRDGVINEERDYVWRIQDFQLLPGAAQGLLTLQKAGYALVVVTNQAGIARGFYTEADYALLTQHMEQLLSQSGVSLAGIYHCPHHPQAGLGAYKTDCSCRKPRPGMLMRAAADLGLRLDRSLIVGDKGSDLQAGRAAGVRWALLVESGHATTEADRLHADATLADLAAAAAWVVGREA